MTLPPFTGTLIDAYQVMISDRIQATLIPENDYVIYALRESIEQLEHLLAQLRKPKRLWLSQK